MTPLRLAYFSSSMQNLGGAERVNSAVLTQLDRAYFAPHAIFLKTTGDLGRRLAAQNVPVHELGLRNRRAVLIALLKVRRVLKSHSIQVLFTAEDRLCMGIAAVLRRWRAVPRYVVALHGTRAWKGYRRLIHAQAVHCADKVVLLSERNRQFWQQQYRLPDSKIAVIPNGIPLNKFRVLSADEKFALRCRYNLHPTRFTVGLIAFFKDSKNLPGFVQVARKVIDRGIDAQFVLVGDGPERPLVEEAIDAYGLQSRFHLPGVTDAPEIWYGMFDLALMTSLTEAFPLTLIEAMACGLPVVATRVGGVADIVVEGETGYIAEPHDLETLAEQVATIAQAPSLWEQMSLAGRERALRNFDIQSMIDNYARLFLSLAPERLK
jgi:glycosyltransferase involved in cell wall biosynthesis